MSNAKTAEEAAGAAFDDMMDTLEVLFHMSNCPNHTDQEREEAFVEARTAFVEFAYDGEDPEANMVQKPTPKAAARIHGEVAIEQKRADQQQGSLMPQLTGRYKFESRWCGVVLYVEEGNRGGVRWRKARPADLKDEKIEHAVGDGWRFPEERYGMLYIDKDGTGRRDREHKRLCGCSDFGRHYG